VFYDQPPIMDVCTIEQGRDQSCCSRFSAKKCARVQSRVEYRGCRPERIAQHIERTCLSVSICYTLYTMNLQIRHTSPVSPITQYGYRVILLSCTCLGLCTRLGNTDVLSLCVRCNLQNILQQCPAGIEGVWG
jgi:hypothetical protein